MDCKRVEKTFKVVGIKGEGLYTNFGVDVPKLAQHFLIRSEEIGNHSGTEVALFEPKKNENHLEGHFYVGLIVNESRLEVPNGMEFLETTKSYITTRGKMNEIDRLHKGLLEWANNHEIKRDLESYIVETYQPMGNGEEEVEIYLPIH